MVSQLFRAGLSLLPSVDDIANISSQVEDIGEAFQYVTTAANGFYQSVIASNIELQSMVRRSATVLAAQTNFFDKAGNSIDDVSAKYDFLAGKLQQIQRDIEIQTRNIVGATDQTTNAVLDNVISNFSNIRGQSKLLKDDLDGITPLVVNLTSALKTFSIPDEQIPQEIRSLLNGEVNNADSILGNRLRDIGLTKEIAEQAKATGTYYDLLIEKTKTFVDFNAVGATSLTNSFSIIKDTISQFMRELGGNPTLGLEKGLSKVIALISDSGFIDGLTAFAKAFGEPIGNALEISLGKITAKFQEMFSYITPTELAAKGAAIGKLIGDLISLGGDAVTIISVLIGKVADFAGSILSAIEIATDLVNFSFSDTKNIIFNSNINEVSDEVNYFSKAGDIVKNFYLKPFKLDLVNDEVLGFVSKMKPETTIDLNTPDARKYQEAYNEIQKQLDSKGTIGKVIEIIGKLSIFGAARSDNINEIKESAKGVVDLFNQELENNQSRIKQLTLEAPKIAEIDTSAINGFVVDLSKSLESEIARLRGTIDFSKLTDDGANKIIEQLNSISSSSELQQAANSIAKTYASSLANVNLNDFYGQLNNLTDSMNAIKAARDEILSDAKAGDYVSSVAAQIQQLTVQEQQYAASIDNILASSDKRYNDQLKVIQGLEAQGKSTKEAQEELNKLREAAIESGQVIASAMSPPSKGQTLVASFTEVKNAMAAFVATLGDNSEKIDADYEGLLTSIEQANQLGAISSAELQNVLLEVAKTDTLSIEQRMSALEKLNQAITEEINLKRSLIEVQTSLIDLQLQSGSINSDQAAILQNEQQIKQTSLDIEEKTSQVLVEKEIITAGLTEQINKQTQAATDAYNIGLSNLDNLLATGKLTQAQYDTKVAELEAVKSVSLEQVSQIQKQATLGSLATQKTIAEIESLKVNREVLIAKETELGLAEKLRESSDKLAISQAKFAADNAKYLAELRQNDNLDEFSKANLETQANLLTLKQSVGSVEAELAAKRQAYNDSEGASYEFRQGLLIEVYELTARLAEQQTELYVASQEAALADATELRNRAELYAQLSTNEINSDYALIASKQKIMEALRANLNYQQQITKEAQNTQVALNNIKVSKIDFDLGLLEQAVELRSQLDNFKGSEEEREWLLERLEIINQATGQEASIVDLIKQKAELETANNKTIYEQKVAQFNLDKANSDAKLLMLDLELQKELALLDVKQQQLQSEKDLLLTKQALGETLSEQEKSALFTLQNNIEANKNNKESLEVTRAGLTDQKQLIAEIFTNSLKVAQAELEHKNNVIQTNSQLDIQNQKKATIQSKSTSGGSPTGGSTTFKVNGGSSGGSSGKPTGSLSSTKKRDGSTTYKINGKEVSQSQFNEAKSSAANSTFKSNSSSPPTFVIPPKRKKSTKATKKPTSIQLRDTTQLPDTKTPLPDDPRVNQETSLNNQLQDFKLKIDEKYVVGNYWSTGDNGKRNLHSFDRNQEGKRVIFREDYDNMIQANRTKILDNYIGSSDVLEKQFGLATKAVDTEVKLIAEQLKQSSRQDKALMDRLKAELELSNKELKSIASYSVLSYRLQNNAKDLQKLGEQRQTTTTISEINKIADELLDFYSAEQANIEIIELGKQLEALRKSPDATSQQIIDLATRIKSATEATADNTKSDTERYTSILDAIKQGGFFTGSYKEANGVVTKSGNELVYSGFKFSNSTIAGQLSNSKANELIKDIQLTDNEVKKEEKGLAPAGVPGKVIPVPAQVPVPTPLPTPPVVVYQQPPVPVYSGMKPVNGGSINITPKNHISLPSKPPGLTMITNNYPNLAGSTSANIRLAGL